MSGIFENGVGVSVKYYNKLNVEVSLQEFENTK
jgi:hypothetical protein